jgi:prepilin-type N-terminal cleavage/methylation domain-containing protein
MSTRASKFRSRASLTRRDPRRGFTLVEILIVIVMISLIAIVAIPRFSTGNGRRNMESARMRISSALSTARQAAIQKGETVQFRIKANQVRVFALSDTVRNLLSPAPLDTLYDVNASIGGSSAEFNVIFSARGFANVGTTKTILLARSGVPNDSVMVLATGMVQR